MSRVETQQTAPLNELPPSEGFSSWKERLRDLNRSQELLKSDGIAVLISNIRKLGLEAPDEKSEVPFSLVRQPLLVPDRYSGYHSNLPDPIRIMFEAIQMAEYRLKGSKANFWAAIPKHGVDGLNLGANTGSEYFVVRMIISRHDQYSNWRPPIFKGFGTEMFEHTIDNFKKVNTEDDFNKLSVGLAITKVISDLK